MGSTGRSRTSRACRPGSLETSPGTAEGLSQLWMGPESRTRARSPPTSQASAMQADKCSGQPYAPLTPRGALSSSVGGWFADRGWALELRHQRLAHQDPEAPASSPSDPAGDTAFGGVSGVPSSVNSCVRLEDRGGKPPTAAPLPGYPSVCRVHAPSKAERIGEPDGAPHALHPCCWPLVPKVKATCPTEPSHPRGREQEDVMLVPQIIVAQGASGMVNGSKARLLQLLHH